MLPPRSPGDTQPLELSYQSKRAAKYVGGSARAREKVGDAWFYPFACTSAAHIDWALAGLANQGVTSPLQFPVKLIEDDI